MTLFDHLLVSADWAIVFLLLFFVEKCNYFLITDLRYPQSTFTLSSD